MRNQYSLKDQYFLKDKKINLIKVIYDDEHTYDARQHYQYYAKNIWAYASQLSQDQTFLAMTYGQSETRMFVINNRKDVKIYDIIEYKGAFYSITRIDTKDDYNGDMFIYVKTAPIGGTPRDIREAS